MTTAPTPAIAHYWLYGDQSSDVALDLLHVERIRDRSGPNDWTIRPHSHPDHMQVFLLREGGGTVRIEDQIHDILPPALVVMPAGIVHRFDFLAGTDGMVVTAALGSLKAAAQIDAELRAAVIPGVLPIAGSGLDPDEVVQAFDQLYNEFVFDAPGRRAAIMALFTRIMVHVLRLSRIRDDAGFLSPDRDYDLVKRYRALLEDNFRQERSIGFYADALAVTPARLNAACKTRAGRTASALLHDRILIEAKRQLIYGESNVAQVAHLVGFDDPAYFNRFFTRRVGVPPGAYRRTTGR